MSDSRFRQFDFWVGTWDVYTAGGQLAGTNTISRAEDGCALIEKWQGSGGSTGMSINYFDPSTKSWRQYWVAASGYFIELEGQLDDEAMVMEGKLIQQNGSAQDFRGTWSPLDDGRVRQHFEVVDTTNTWATWFDGYYQRSEEAE